MEMFWESFMIFCTTLVITYMVFDVSRRIHSRYLEKTQNEKLYTTKREGVQASYVIDIYYNKAKRMFILHYQVGHQGTVAKTTQKIRNSSRQSLDYIDRSMDHEISEIENRLFNEKNREETIQAIKDGALDEENQGGIKNADLPDAWKQ